MSSSITGPPSTAVDPAGASPLDVAVLLVAPTDARAHDALPLLSAAERARDARFQHAGARAQFRVGRWLARTALAARLGLAPADVPLVETDRGALLVDPRANPDDLRFNLSHTDGLVALALAPAHPVGVDVEDTTRPGRQLAIADRFFAPSEVAALRRLPPERQRARFFDYWTLKESYIKARGLGLAIPLGHFAFELDRPGPITIAFDPRLDDDPARWHFHHLDPTPRHRVAVAVAASAPPTLCVSWAP